MHPSIAFRRNAFTDGPLQMAIHFVVKFNRSNVSNFWLAIKTSADDGQFAKLRMCISVRFEKRMRATSGQ